MRFFGHTIVAIFLVLVLATPVWSGSTFQPGKPGSGNSTLGGGNTSSTSGTGFSTGFGNTTAGQTTNGGTDPRTATNAVSTLAPVQDPAALAAWSKQMYGKLTPDEIQVCGGEAFQVGEWNGLKIQYVKKCGWTVRMISLSRAYILRVMQKWFDYDMATDDFMKAYMSLIFLLALTLHGVKMTAGEMQNPMAESVILLIKMGAVTYFVFNFDKYAHLPFVLLDFLTMLPSQVLDVLLDGDTILHTQVWGTNGMTCIALPQEAEYLSLWMRIDCLVSRLIGVSFSWTDSWETIAGGLLILILVFFATGFFSALSLAIFIFLVSIIFFCIGAFLKAVLSYVKAMINLMILLAVAVLFLPFAVLPQSVMGGVTEGVFNNLIKQILDSIIVPFLLYTYMTFFVVVVALSYQDLYASFMVIEGSSTVKVVGAGGHSYAKSQLQTDSCPFIAEGSWSTVKGAVKKAVATAYNIASVALVGDFDLPCWDKFSLGNVMYQMALKTVILLLVSYLMFVYYSHFMALTAELAGQLDADILATPAFGGVFHKLMSGLKKAAQAYSPKGAGGP